jgi:glucose/arabinose dehydrogenase
MQMYVWESVMRKRPVIVSVAATLAGAALTAAVVTSTAPASAQIAGGFDFTRPEVVASGLVVPWGMAFLPDGSALVSERNSGRVLQLRVGQAPQPVATINGVSATGEAGLLGLAVSPTYAQDQWVYAYFTSASDNRIVRFRLASPQTQPVILSGLARASIHDGGRIAFGPDGMLYAGVGDANNAATAQNQQSLNGKILRMTPTGGVPAGNPFGNLVYSMGHRNVQGLAWDAQGRMWASEFGQNTWDEINQIVAGGNYGWPTVEGMGTNPQFRNPAVVWTTAEASPSGLAFANNTLFAAALRGQRLWTVPVNSNGTTGTPVAELQGQYGRLRTVMRGPDGWLWVATSNRDGRGTPVAADDRVLRFPPVGSPTSTASTSTAPTTTTTTSRPPTTTTTTSRPPTTTSRPPTTTTTTTAPPGACSATYQQINVWPGGLQGEVTVRNTGSSAVSAWTVTFTFPDGQTITQLWNGVHTQSGATVTVRNAPWNGSLGPGATTTFGFLGAWSGTNGAPINLTCR